MGDNDVNLKADRSHNTSVGMSGVPKATAPASDMMTDVTLVGKSDAINVSMMYFFFLINVCYFMGLF